MNFIVKYKQQKFTPRIIRAYVKLISRTFGIAFGIAFVPAFRSNLNFFFFFAKIECGLYFLDRFDVLMSKIIFKK
jgi:hypothetical protein